MSRYYKILAKARRAGDLFDEQKAQPSPASPESQPQVADSSATPLDAHDQAPRTPWQQLFAEAAGNPGLAQATRLGLFSFDGQSLAAIALSAAQWMARQSEDPVLLAEADWSRSSGVAGMLQLDRRGLGNAINDAGAHLDSLIQEGPLPNLAVLGSGAVPKTQAPRLAEKIGGVLNSLRRRYPHVLLVMPPPDGPDWPGFESTGLVDASLLVVRPRSANRKRIEQGIGRLRASGFPVVGCLLDDGARTPVSMRLSHLAQPQAGADL